MIVRRAKQLRHERGFLMITSLMLLSLCLTFSSIGMTRSMTELSSTRRYLASQQAFHAAEAALDEAIAEFKTNYNFSSDNGWSNLTLTDPVNDQQNILNCKLAGTTTVTRCVSKNVTSLGGATSTAIVVNPDGVQPIIRGQGTVGTVSKTLQVTVGGISGFIAAFGASDYIDLGEVSPLSTDSYDSRLGAYNALLAGGSRNIGSHGDLLTNIRV